MLTILYFFTAPRSSAFASPVKNRHRRRIPSRRTFGISCSTRVHIGSMVRRAKQNAGVSKPGPLTSTSDSNHSLLDKAANLKCDARRAKLAQVIVRSSKLDSSVGDRLFAIYQPAWYQTYTWKIKTRHISVAQCNAQRNSKITFFYSCAFILLHITYM